MSKNEKENGTRNDSSDFEQFVKNILTVPPAELDEEMENDRQAAEIIPKPSPKDVQLLKEENNSTYSLMTLEVELRGKHLDANTLGDELRKILPRPELIESVTPSGEGPNRAEITWKLNSREEGPNLAADVSKLWGESGGKVIVKKPPQYT